MGQVVSVVLLGVRMVLLTDLLLFLTERDQKYQLANLQDVKGRYVSVTVM